MKYKNKLSLVAVIGGALSIIFFLISLKDRTYVRELARPISGDGAVRQELQVEIEGKKYPFSVVLEELPWEEDAIRGLLEEALDGIEEIFLKDNTDLWHITSRVSMPSAYKDTPIAIQWYLDSWKYIEPDGNVRNEGLTEPVTIKVQAILSLEGQSLIWEHEVLVCPFEHPNLEQKLRMLTYQIQKAQQERTENLVLPERVAKEEITWYLAKDQRFLWVLALTVLSLGVMIAGRRQEEEKEQKKRIRSMQLDYPDIVSRLSLYMGAGISTRKSWERMLEKKKEEGHIAYEEMRITLREMQSGIPEALAYERFGMRCQIPAYRKLGTLLSQNLRKGTKNLAEILKEESRDAFEDRKALAKRMGEECESKLLFPMLLMLLTVLILVMYPAVISFQM